MGTRGLCHNSTVMTRAFLARLAAFVVCAGCCAGLPALAQRATVEVSVNMAGDSARLVLTHSRHMNYILRESEGRIDILYAEPIQVQPSGQRFEDPILSRYEHIARDRLTFFTGPGYRTYENFELRNPFRLVLDLRGTRAGAGTERGTLPKRRESSKTIVVIDPGHGGIETGAVGPTGLQEKDVTLDLARRLQQVLERDPAIAVVLTRDEDRLVGLDERTAIANHNRAALFVSIHLNGSPRVSARGAETFFLSTDATDDEARTLAALENRSSGVESKELVTVDGEKRKLDLVLWDLAQNQFFAESSSLAESVQRQFNELSRTRDRGVRQAPFRVLMGATMPAILVEVGFISNPAEEERFRSLTHRNDTVTAIATAVRGFLHDLERLAPPEVQGVRGSSPP